MHDMYLYKDIKLMNSILIIYGTFYLARKIIDKKQCKNYKTIVTYVMIFIITVLYRQLRNYNNYLNSTIILIFLLSALFAISTKNKIGYSIFIIVISLSISYIVYILSLALCYIPLAILRNYNLDNGYLCIFTIAIIYIIILVLLYKIKRIKNGLTFLQRKMNNDYMDILVLNISIIIIFLVTLIVTEDYEKQITNNFGIALIFFAIIMFITIQKSLQLYYKQKMLIKDLNETKEELANKNKEIEELEKENLNFSKISHSIAHKQKALEYKLNTLITNSEIAEETDLKDRIENITKDLKQETIIKLEKSEIPEIDDMLEYMQSECIKNKIDFQLQLSGNIHHMVNNYVSKEKLEILLADLIKNAIIAINYAESSNKSILVRMGIIEGVYSLYVYDSGIEFELETLTNLGIKPSTTHADNGGTGMGMMNIFDTLKEYKASMTINEYGKPSKDNFTKVIKIEFDKKNEFKIKSYRQEEIEKINKYVNSSYSRIATETTVQNKNDNIIKSVKE